MRIFKTKSVIRFAKGEHIADSSLAEAIERAEKGLIDADLGGGLIKQRVARKGQGKSGGFRMIVAYRVKDRVVFLYGFAKNQRDNIAPNDLESLRVAAVYWFEASDAQIATAIEDGTLQEIDHEEAKTPNPA